MVGQRNKAIAARFLDEAYNRRNVDTVDEVMAADYVYHSPDSARTDAAGRKDVISMYLAAFPDLRLTIEAQYIDGDTVTTRWRAHGKHEGDLVGIEATGRQVVMTRIIIDRITEDKISESWEEYDRLGMIDSSVRR